MPRSSPTEAAIRAEWGIAGARRSARPARRGGRHDGLPRRAGDRHRRPAAPGQVVRRARRARRAGRRGAPRGRRAPRRSGAQADGRFVVETERGAIHARDVLVATNGYTDGAAPSLRRRIIPIGSYIIATEPLPEDLARELSPTGRAYFDTRNFLSYWHVSADRRLIFGGPGQLLPDDGRPNGEAAPSPDARGPPAGRGLPRRVLVGRQDRDDVRPDAAHRAVRRRDVRDGLLRQRRRPAALARDAGRRVDGRRRAAGAREARFPLVPAPYEGRPWFLPVVGEFFRAQDRLAAREKPAP